MKRKIEEKKPATSNSMIILNILIMTSLTKFVRRKYDPVSTILYN